MLPLRSMAKTKKYRNRSFEFHEDERGFYYLRILEGEEFTDTDAAHLQQWMRQEGSGEKKPLLVELGYGSTVSPGILRTFAQKLKRVATADAILVGSFAHRLMANFYLRQHKPELPTRIFSDVFEALAWLERFKSGGATAHAS